MSLVLHLFDVSLVLVRACCRVPASPGIPGCAGEILDFGSFSSAASAEAAPHAAAGRAPSRGQCYLRRHPASCGDTRQLHHILWPSSDLLMLERDLPCVADQAPPALTLAVHTASCRGFLPFSIPLSQPSGGGRLRYVLSEMTCRKARFRDSRRRISTQACLVKCTFFKATKKKGGE